MVNQCPSENILKNLFGHRKSLKFLNLKRQIEGSKFRANPLLLLKQVGGLGPWCPETGCPLFFAFLLCISKIRWLKLAQKAYENSVQEDFCKMVYC